MNMPEDNCPICKDVFRDKVMREPCGHEFCKSCLDRWYNTADKKICPFCRQTEEENDNLYFSEEEDEVDEELYNNIIIEDVYSDSNFINKLYYYFFKNIYYFLSSHEPITDYYIDAEVYCDDITIFHRFDLRGEPKDESLVKYFMKYFSHASSAFTPNGTYHYSNDAENYKIGVQSSQSYLRSGYNRIKLRYILLILEPKSGYTYDVECPKKQIFYSSEEFIEEVMSDNQQDENFSSSEENSEEDE